MFENEINELEKTITQKENLKLIKKISKQFYHDHSVEECWIMINECYQSQYFQIQEIAVLLCGYIGHLKKEAVMFLKEQVSFHQDWRVQEVLAMAFDLHCSLIGYENCIPIIKEWLSSDHPNHRRAVSEGLRVWTSRPYFKDYPQVAIQILSSYKEDESLYVRKSIGNALRDISRKHSSLIEKEISTWDLSNRKIKQVYTLAGRLIKK